MNNEELRNAMETVELTEMSDSEIIDKCTNLILGHVDDFASKNGDMSLLTSMKGIIMSLKQNTKYLRGREPEPSFIRNNIEGAVIPYEYRQLIVAIEELIELAIEVIRGIESGGKNHLELTEEIADVRVTIDYIIKLFNIDPEDISKVHHIKYERVKQRIESDNMK